MLELPAVHTTGAAVGAFVVVNRSVVVRTAVVDGPMTGTRQARPKRPSPAGSKPSNASQSAWHVPRKRYWRFEHSEQSPVASEHTAQFVEHEHGAPELVRPLTQSNPNGTVDVGLAVVVTAVVVVWRSRTDSQILPNDPVPRGTVLGNALQSSWQAPWCRNLSTHSAHASPSQKKHAASAHPQSVLGTRSQKNSAITVVGLVVVVATVVVVAGTHARPNGPVSCSTSPNATQSAWQAPSKR